jgi:predicted O-methyltransferase YrrM
MNLDFFDFNPTLQAILSTRKTVGRSGKEFAGVGALSSDNNLVTLRNLCLRLKPERTLEIGMAFGGSALVFTASHRDLGCQSARQHMALDPFQSSVWDDAGVFAIKRAGLQGYLDFRPAFSSIELPRLVSEIVLFDLVYVDGSHLFEDVFIDFYYVARLLRDGGIVAFDDCTDPNIAKVLAFISRNLRSSFEEVDLGPFRSDGGRTLRYRAAKILGKTQLRAFRRTGAADRNWDAAFTDF